MKNAGFIPLDFACYFEPESGINSPREFTDELFLWAEREKKNLVILEESMEPVIELDGSRYRCRLADPRAAEQNNPIRKMLFSQGVTHSVGPLLGYKWVYLYKTDEGESHAAD